MNPRAVLNEFWDEQYRNIEMKQLSELLAEAPELTFEMWWEVYPRKQGKAKAEKIWDKLSIDQRSACYLGTEKQVRENPQWRNPKYIPMPTTFLNQQRWQDEIVEEKTAVARVTEEAQSTQTKHDFVWAAMTQMYGNAWVSRYGETPPEVWIKYLQGIEWPRIKRGCRMVMESGDLMTPSLPKFLDYCKKTFEEQYPPALPPSSKTRPEDALKHLAEMKRILGVPDE